MDDDTDGKEELLRVILETEKTHAAGQKEASEIVELMQAGRERARIVRDLIPHIPAENRKQLTTAWQRENDAARAITHEIRELRTGYAVSFNSSVMATSTAALSISVSFPKSPPPTPAVSNALAQLNLLMGREKLLEKVRDGLVRCGLDRSQGENRSAWSLVEESALAMSRPPDVETVSTAALVTLRDGIRRAIVDVFSRCKGQEKARPWSEKILSVAKRCGRAELSDGYFQQLADLAASKIGEWSAAKDQSMDREQLLLAYFDALAYLVTFLDGVDETRLRGSAT